MKTKILKHRTILLLIISFVSIISCKTANELDPSTDDSGSGDNPTNTSAKKWVSVKSTVYGTLALKEDGTLWAWGSRFGNVGLGNLQESLKPMQVLDNVKDFVYGRARSEGTATALVIRSNGTLWGAGFNHYINSTMAACGLPIYDSHMYYFLDDHQNIRTQFLQIGSDANWSNFMLPQYFSGSLTKNNLVYHIGPRPLEKWVYGALGTCGEAWRISQTLYVLKYERVSEYNDWKELSVTDALGIKQDGTLWYYPPESSIKAINPNIPLQIGNEKNWKTILWTQNLILKNDGTLWKFDRYYGTVEKFGQDVWKTVYTNTDGYHRKSYGIKNDGTLWAWGNNSDGLLGTGDYNSYTTPTKISSENNWIYLYYPDNWSNQDGNNVFVINTKGEIWGWGKNSYGSLGNGNKNDVYVPTLLQGIK